MDLSPEEKKKFDEAYDRRFEEWVNDEAEDDCEDNEDEDDEGLLMVSSLLERQVCQDGQKVCQTCGQKAHTVLGENPNKCEAEIHKRFKELFEYRIAVGEKCLELFGMD